jgi:hypothetical protein
MSSDTDSEAQQVVQAAPRAGAFFSLFLITVEVVTARKEEVGGAETHEMDILGPQTDEGVTSIGLAVSSRDDNFVLLQDPGGKATFLR